MNSLKTVLTPLFVILLILLAIPASWELLKPSYFTTHDGIGHIIRLQEFDIALKDGHFPPRLSKNLMYGYGYYFFNFNYPLVYWLGEAVHLLGANFTISLNMVSLGSLVLSGITMFLWQRNHWGNWGGLVSGIFYIYAPYRFLNVYVRGALAEHLAFVILPLLFMFTEKIAEGESRKRLRYTLLAGVSYALLVLSHNIMAFIFTIVLGLFMLFHVLLKKQLVLLLYFTAVGTIGLLLSAFFWIPSLAEKEYVRLDQTIGKDYPDHFVSPEQLWQRKWEFGASIAGSSDEISFQVGLLHLTALLLGTIILFLLWKKHQFRAIHTAFYIGVFFLSIFLMLPYSRLLWDKLPLLAFTQFPWRFLSWTVLSTSVLAGASVFTINEGAKKLDLKHLSPLIAILVISLLLFLSKDYWKVDKRASVDLPSNKPIAGSTTWADEQFPIWFEPKPSQIPKSRVEIVSGEGRVSITSWKTASHEYKIVSQTPVLVVENTAYYPGWNLQANGKDLDFSYQDRNFPGRIVYSLPSGSFQITTTFQETPLRKIANTTSLISLISLTTLLSINLLLKKVFW
ncbi:MAG: hypothetical protein HYU80_00840 [Candidatus Blackburnbacteria bacterium]|nr:hypothetical protein [Candidatus Blackburnbacteria bacterium]